MHYVYIGFKFYNVTTSGLSSAMGYERASTLESSELELLSVCSFICSIFVFMIFLLSPKNVYVILGVASLMLLDMN